MGNAEHGTNYYVRIYAILVASVAAVIVLGPIVGNFFVIMGVALVIATFKAGYFMHMATEKRYIWLLMIVSIVSIFGFFFGSARDIMMHEGQSWKRCNAINDANRERIAQAVETAAEHYPSKMAGITAPGGVDCVPQRF